MNDLTMTVAGWVATEPRHVVGPTGTHLTSFRMASTSRYLDRDNIGNRWYRLCGYSHHHDLVEWSSA